MERATRARRIVFVDLLRLVASFQMITGHTIDGLLAQELRTGTVFERWTWVRGLTSVAFMVAAGMSFHLSTLARFDRHKGDPSAVRRRVRRGAWLVILGYLLHFPAGVFFGDAAEATRAWHEFQIADVLQCIGGSILALEGLTLIARRPAHVVVASSVLAVAAFALGPLGDLVTPDGPWRFALNYVSHRSGSLFPLVPWSGFVFAGVAVAAVALPGGGSTDPALATRRLVACAIAILAAALALDLAPLGIASAQTSQNARPAFNVLKLGLVIGATALIALLGQRIDRLSPRLSALASESLTLYVSHLLVLYASGVGLYRVIGHTLGVPAALGAAALMLIGASLVALGWHRLKAMRLREP